METLCSLNIKTEWILKPPNVKLRIFNNDDDNNNLISTMKIWNKNQNSSVFESQLNLRE